MIFKEGDVEYEFREVDGKYGFYNVNNERYEGSTTSIYTLERSLNIINSSAIGNLVINQLIESSETLTFEFTFQENGTDNETYTNSNGQIVERSSTISWNPSNTRGGSSLDTDGNITTVRPAYVGLAHEIGHAYDHIILNGKWGSQLWYNTKTETIDKSEFFAGTFENIIRFENNISPRIYYGRNSREGSYLKTPKLTTIIFLYMANLKTD